MKLEHLHFYLVMLCNLNLFVLQFTFSLEIINKTFCFMSKMNKISSKITLLTVFYEGIFECFLVLHEIM